MKLDLDQLQVVSFEPQAVAAPEPIGAISGEDCFTRLSFCCTRTTIAL
jgi:hypothetical protein